MIVFRLAHNKLRRHDPIHDSLQTHRHRWWQPRQSIIKKHPCALTPPKPPPKTFCSAGCSCGKCLPGTFTLTARATCCGPGYCRMTSTLSCGCPGGAILGGGIDSEKTKRPEKKFAAAHKDIVFCFDDSQTHPGGCFCVGARGYFHQDSDIHSPLFTILHVVLIMFHYWQYWFGGVGLAFSISTR